MSNNKKCGCGETTSTDKSYMMIEATASESPSCNPDSSTGTGNEDCPKGEFMFDMILSEFVVPLSTGSVNVQVCNPAIYAVGMWWQFLSPKLIMKVIAINGPIITLANRCDNGDVISGNPTAGTAVTQNAKFIVASAPGCRTEEEIRREIFDALEGALELPLPSLQETTATENSQVVGLVLNDPNDITQGKALKRLRGFGYSGTTPKLSGLKTVEATAWSTHRQLVKHNTTHEVVRMKNLNETPGLAASAQYFQGVNKNNGMKLIGPAYACRPLQNTNLIERNTASDDHLSWPTFNNNKTVDLDLSSYAAVSGADTLLDHFFATIRLEIGCSAAGGTLKALKASLNDIYAGRAFGAQSADYMAQFNSITMTVRVLYSNPKITLKLEADGTVRHYYAAYLDGVSY